MLSDIIAYYQNLSSNPVFAGFIAAYGIGVITFVCRDIPFRIWYWLKYQLTTSLTVNNEDIIYYDFLGWVSTHHFHSWIRTLNFSSRRDDYTPDSETPKFVSIGYGFSFFFWKRHLFFLYRSVVDASNTKEVKERLEVVVLGRSQKIFSELFDEVIKFQGMDDKHTRVFGFEHGHWSQNSRHFKRPMESVIIEEAKKDAIITHIKNFESRRDWYREHGIPYKTGLLLHGPAGTGKTSLVKALAAHFERNIYNINFSLMSDASLASAMNSAPPNSIVLIEDIDSLGIKLKRDSEKNKDNYSDSPGGWNKLTLAGILNSIDGVDGGEGRVLIATTNYPDKLDAALVRKGRFDIHVELGEMTEKMLEDYLKRFYTDFVLPENFKIKHGVVAATVQQLVMDNISDVSKVLEAVRQ